PSPQQLFNGKQGGQSVLEGFAFLARVQVSPDRRFVRVKLTEQAAELQEIQKQKVWVPAGVAGDKKVDAEVPFVKETSYSQVRELPDGGTVLIPLHYRAASLPKGRW